MVDLLYGRFLAKGKRHYAYGRFMYMLVSGVCSWFLRETVEGSIPLDGLKTSRRGFCLCISFYEVLG